VQFDPGTSRVRVQDQSISLQSGNVILVDEVDGATGCTTDITGPITASISTGFDEG
jgi:hypothetical protein